MISPAEVCACVRSVLQESVRDAVRVVLEDVAAGLLAHPFRDVRVRAAEVQPLEDLKRKSIAPASSRLNIDEDVRVRRLSA